MDLSEHVERFERRAYDKAYISVCVCFYVLVSL